MHRLTKFLSSLEHYELVKLKNEIDKGLLDVDNEIQGYIKDHEKKHARYCTTCSNDLDTYNTNNYTLIFGPEDFMKKASFCGLDCLEYFFTKLKQIKKDTRKTVDGKHGKKIE
jgi:hypothetical protein